MKRFYSLNTSTIRPAPLIRKIEVTGKAGYNGIELWCDEIREYIGKGNSIKDVVHALEDNGLRVPSVISLYGWMDSKGEGYEKALDEVRRRMELAAEVGASYIVATPSIREDRTEVDLDDVARRYSDLMEIGRQFGVLPAMEFLGFTTTIYRVDQAWEVVKRSGAEDGTIVLDSFHLYRGGSSLDDVPDIDGRRIAIFHINDVPPGKEREKLKDEDRVMPGDGILPLGEIISKLDSIGYGGFVSLELFNRDLWEKDPLEVARIGLEKTMEAVER
jgi:2-keto-myo-inositol isomerase